jgi:surfactin synthase thioesterase subunit
MLAETDSKNWLAGLGRQPTASYRLYCFPYAGGSAFAFRDWVAAQLEICPVLLPGRDKRSGESAYTRLTLLAEHISEALPVERPYALFGHSMGATLAFETARTLRRKGRPAPKYLFCSGCIAPHLRSRGRQKLRHLMKDEELINELRFLQGTPEEVLGDHSLMHMLMPTLRADFESVEMYHYEESPALECPIAVFGGTRDLEVNREELTAWRQHTRSHFSIRMLAGDHFFLHEHRVTMLYDIRAALCGVPVRRAIGA